MVIKINKKPIQVKQEEDREGIDWMYLTTCGIGSFLGLWLMDDIAGRFLGSHPFPFTHFIGVILSWFG